MVSNMADRTKLDKALSNEAINKVTDEIDAATRKVQASRKKMLQDAKQSTTKKKEPKTKEPKTEIPDCGYPKENLGKKAGRIAAKRLMDSLVTPANAPEPKRKGRAPAMKKARWADGKSSYFEPCKS